MSKDMEKRKKSSKGKSLENEFYLDDEDCLNIISDIKSSKYRQAALKTFMENQDPKTPSEMAKILGIGISHTSRILTDLKNYNLIVCTNEEAKRNKNHELTSFGRDIGEIIFKPPIKH